ncbi:MAG TPA: phosphatidylglycerophosphatase A [Alphaproteobacteria bacterium]|nr:phosphatidylglycerophosphatase A [Alphaproteobacteria bacterium]
MSDRTPAGRAGFWHPVTLIATWFGVGLLPKAPGTWGSLSALLYAWVIQTVAGPVGLAVAFALVFPLGVWAANAYARLKGERDPGAVVVDEVAGQWLTVLVMPPDLVLYAVGFALFRFFDIVKVWPASLIERRVGGGLGIMLDDIVAAVYAGAALFALSGLLTGSLRFAVPGALPGGAP